MRKIFTLALFMMTTMVVEAQFKSILRFAATSTVDYIVINGRTYYMNDYNNQIEITQLPAGKFKWKAYAMKTVNNRNVRRTEPVLLYQGEVKLMDGYITKLQVNRNGKSSVQYELIKRWDDNRHTTYGYPNYPTYQQKFTMPDDKFQSLLRAMKNASFDDSKLMIAQQALDVYYIDTDQLVSMMKVLSFESTKLSLAKYGYKRLVDPENIFLVNSAFSFQSSIKELYEYTRS